MPEFEKGWISRQCARVEKDAMSDFHEHPCGEYVATGCEQVIACQECLRCADCCECGKEKGGEMKHMSLEVEFEVEGTDEQLRELRQLVETAVETAVEGFVKKLGGVYVVENETIWQSRNLPTEIQ